MNGLIAHVFDAGADTDCAGCSAGSDERQVNRGSRLIREGYCRSVDDKLEVRCASAVMPRRAGAARSLA